MTRIVVLTDRFPERSETFVAAEVAALRRAGRDVTVEAVVAPDDSAPGAPDVRWTGETTAVRLRDVAWLIARYPRRCAADLRARRRWRRQETLPPLRMLAPAARRWTRADAHVHVHFAAAAALSAHRIARITGVSWSVTAHAWEIYAHPANLREKLEAAAFATSGCDYTVAELRRIAPGADVHPIVMGVDGDRLRRTHPAPATRTVLAVGRLVEKKGFTDLAVAASALRAAGSPVRVRVAGDGPLRAALAEHPDVELLGAVDHDAVRGLLEDADVLCMPCVVAADGDRDSMPVAVKEALAMEVPVIATRAVGLPEIVRDGWGRLVAPHDPAALAAALDALLSLPASERAAMGRAGREHVLRAADVDAETAKLGRLIDASRDARRAGRPSPGSTPS